MTTKNAVGHSFWIFFLISRQPQRIRKKPKPLKILLIQGNFAEVKLNNPLFCLMVCILQHWCTLIRRVQ